MISAENIYDKFPLQYGGNKIKVLYIINNIIKKLKLENLVYEIYFKLFSQNQKLTYLRPKVVDFCNNISEENSKKDFAILTNDLKGNHILNFPYFFHTHLNKFQELINIKKEKKYTSKKKFCAFIVANPRSRDRINFYKQLSKYKKIDSFGPVLNNTKISDFLIEKYKKKEVDGYNYKNHGADTTNFNLLNQELFRDYKFVICFENSYANDYITEKLPNVMMANSIGIYRGAKNISEFFNTKSFINYDDYRTYEAMIKKIIELDEDDDKYQQMLDEPFFNNNQLPDRIKNAKQDLENFIDKLFA